MFLTPFCIPLLEEWIISWFLLRVIPHQSFLRCPGRHMVVARIGVPIKVRVLYILVEADMGLTPRTQPARVTPTASVSRSMGLHV